jgi:hypothetical protein
MNILRKSIITALFFMIVPIEVFAWPAGLVDVGHTGNPNYLILANKKTKQIAMMVKAPVKKGNVWTAEAVDAFKSSTRCESYKLSKDRKTLTATNCVKNSTKLNLYAPIINREMRMVLYTPSLGMGVAKKIVNH